MRQFLIRTHEDCYQPMIKEDVLNKVVKVQDAILECIETYLEGHPSLAYQCFEKVLESSGIEMEIASLHQMQVPSNSNFFRVQKIVPVKPKIKQSEGWSRTKTPKDLFHPPYECRRAVGTNRFSISGFPCLYLSHDLHTSYSECYPDRDHPGPFLAASFKNARPLYFIDISEDKLIDGKDLFAGGIQFTTATSKGVKPFDTVGHMQYIGIYQLIIACHSKIKYKPRYKGETFYFKAEYILPQMLLQWLCKKDYAIDGIRYRSCTGEDRFPHVKHHYNYVMPASQNIDKGLCPKLLHIFSSSPVYSYNIHRKPRKPLQFLKDIQDKLIGRKIQSLV